MPPFFAKLRLRLGCAAKPAHRLIFIFVPLGLFLSFFHAEILDPTRINWVMREDWGQHALGWHAFRNSPWVWPFNHETLLSYPSGLSIIYTDSNPLLAFLFKALSPLLPANFQYIGLWFFLCVTGQFIASYLLLRRHAPDRWMALGGAILMSLLPALYHRMIHDTLMAHGLILMALYIYLEMKSEPRKTLAWMGLLAACGFLHPYILFMVLMIWGGDQIRDMKPVLITRDRKAVARLVARCFLTVLAPVLTLTMVGVFSGQTLGDEGFGTYSMALDAPFNPGRTGWSMIFKAHPTMPGQADEGFQYMGAGLLFLIVAAVILYRIDEGARTVRPLIERLRPLKWPLVMLLFLALSNRIYFSEHRIIRFSIPDPFKPLFCILRASGRLFWPLAYVAVWLALLTLYRSQPRRAQIILVSALFLQIVDLQGFASAMRAQTADANEIRPYTLTPAAKWDQIMARASEIEFYPPNPYINKPLFYELAWRGVSHHVPVNIMYTARQDRFQDLLQEQGRLDFINGKINPSHLYIFLNPCNAPQTFQNKLRKLDGIWFIPPTSALNVVTPSPQQIRYQLGIPILFKWDAPGACSLGTAFAMPEVTGAWAIQPQSTMDLALTTPIHPGSTADITLHSFKTARPVLVFANGTRVATLNVSHTDSTYQIPLSAVSGQRNIMLSFSTPKAVEKTKVREETTFYLFFSKMTVH